MNPRNRYAAVIATMRCYTPFSLECTQRASSILIQEDMGNIIPFLCNESDRDRLILYLQLSSYLLTHSLPETLINGFMEQAEKQAHAIEAIEAIIDHYSRCNTDHRA